MPGNTAPVSTTDTTRATPDDQAAAAPLPPGWSRPRPGHTPRPTYWPAILAIGVACLVWGVVTTWFISLIGLILVVVGLTGWLKETIDGE